jgi:hypothetical protein
MMRIIGDLESAEWLVGRLLLGLDLGSQELDIIKQRRIFPIPVHHASSVRHRFYRPNVSRSSGRGGAVNSQFLLF